MKKPLSMILGLLVGVLAFRVVSNVVSPPLSVDEHLMKAAEEVNKSCPMIVDQETRLDSTIGGPGKRFNYRYTLVHHVREDLDIEEIKNYIEPRLVENVKTDPSMSVFRENNVTIVYTYADKNGTHLLEIEVTPSDYGG